MDDIDLKPILLEQQGPKEGLIKGDFLIVDANNKKFSGTYWLIFKNNRYRLTLFGPFKKSIAELIFKEDGIFIFDSVSSKWNKLMIESYIAESVYLNDFKPLFPFIFGLYLKADLLCTNDVDICATMDKNMWLEKKGKFRYAMLQPWKVLCDGKICYFDLIKHDDKIKIKELQISISSINELTVHDGTFEVKHDQKFDSILQ